MIAALPMYDLPELSGATDVWWAGLRRHFAVLGLAGLPERRIRPDDLVSHWLNDGIILSQTCGYPLTHAVAGRMQLVATPRYAAPGCAGASYVSWVVVRDDDPARDLTDLRGRRVAFNGTDSQSGYNTLRAAVASLAAGGRFFSEAIESGGHRRSMTMVAAGTADVAAVDCVTFGLIARVAAEEVRNLRVLRATAAAPGLPYVTALTTGADDLRRLRQGLANACGDPALTECRRALLIEGFEILPLSAYSVIGGMEQAARDAQYPELR